jgi:hypothetical protein
MLLRLNDNKGNSKSLYFIYYLVDLICQALIYTNFEAINLQCI